MPGTANRATQPPANARLRRAAHREREERNHRKPSPERQARLHPPRSVQRAIKALTYMRTHQADRPGPMRSTVVGGFQIVRNNDPKAFDVDAVIEAVTAIPRPLPWRAPDEKTAGWGWHVLDAEGHIVEYASSRDKARARVKEVNGS